MRHLILLLLCLCLPLQAQLPAIVGLGVTVNTNGQVTAPSTFWGANSNAIRAALGLPYEFATNAFTAQGSSVFLGPVLSLTNNWTVLGADEGVAVEFDELSRFDVTATDSSLEALNSLYVDAGALTLRAITNLVLITPKTFTFSSSSNAVLTLVDRTNGIAEWVSIEAVIADTLSSGRVLVSSSTKTLADSPTTAAEVAHLSGVTNAVQTQISQAERAINVRAYGATGDGTTDDTAAIQAAIDASRSAGGRVYLPAGTYLISSALDTRGITAGARDDSFAALIGEGRAKTRIVSTNKAEPVLRITGRYQTFTGFAAGYDSVCTPEDTAAYVLSMEDWVFFCTFSDLLIENGYRGSSNVEGDLADTANVFSCSFSDIRFLNHIDVAISHVNGTGNAWRNIYVSNQSVDAVRRGIEINGGADTWDQLNIEQSNIRDCVLAINNAHASQIDRLHVEGVRLFGFGSIGTETGAILYTSTRGSVKLSSVWMDQIYVGPQVITSITRSGTTATVTVDNLGSNVVGGHGFRVGDTVTITGASDALYTGTHEVTAVTLTTFSYVMEGTPSADAALSSGHAWFGAQLGTSDAVGAMVAPISQAGIVDIDGLYARDVICTGSTTATRDVGLRLLRYSSTSGFPFDLRVRNLSRVGQPKEARAWTTMRVVGRSRDGTNATVILSQPHALSVGSYVGVQAMASGGYNLAYTPVVSVPNPFSFTYALGSAAETLTNETTGIVVVSLVEVIARARASNVATLTTAFAHGLKRGMRVRTWNMGGTGYSATETVVLSVPGPAVFTYASSGTDEAETAITGGGVMLYDSGFSPSIIALPNNPALVKEAGWLFQAAVVPAFGAVAAGGSSTVTASAPGMAAGARVDAGATANWPSGIVWGGARCVSDNTISMTVHNITGSSVDVPSQLITLQWVNP